MRSLHGTLSYLWLAGNEGKEKRMETTTIMNYIGFRV